MASGERLVQAVGAAVRVAVQVARRGVERRQRRGKRPERPLVRRELDDALEPELALALLDRFAGLVRRQRGDARPEERRVGEARAHAGEGTDPRSRRYRGFDAEAGDLEAQSWHPQNARARLGGGGSAA